MQQVDAFQKTIVAGVKTNPSDTYWIRFVLVNDVDTLSRIVVSNGWNDLVQGYFLPGGNYSLQTSRTGVLLPASKRKQGGLASTMQFDFRPSTDTAMLFLKIQNPYSGYPPQLDFSLLSESAYSDYLQKIRARDNIYIAFQGAVWLMLLFMLLIYVQNRDKVYLYYSLYMMGIMLYLCSTIQSNIYVNYFFREFPLTGLYLNFPIQLLFYIAYNKFVDTFLDLKKNRPLAPRSEEHTTELKSLLRTSYAVLCLKKKNKHNNKITNTHY